MRELGLTLALLGPFIVLALAPCVFDHNTLVIGTSRYGKTFGVLGGEVFPAIQAADTAVVVLDPHRTMGLEVAGYALAHGHADRLIIDDLDDYSRAASIGFVRKSRAFSAAEREAGDLAAARDFAEAASAQRGEAYTGGAGIDGKPLIKEWLIALVMAGLSQPDGYDWRDLPWAFRPGTRQFEAFVAGISRPIQKAKFASLRRFNSEVALYNTVGPAARLIAELWMEPAFRERIRPTLDLEGSLENAMIYVVLGGEEGTTTVLMRSIQLRIKNAVRTYYNRHGSLPLYVRVYIDEAANMRLVGMPEARAMNQMIKMGLSFCVITQTPDFGDDSVNLQVDAGTDVKWIFRCTPPVAELTAKQLSGNLDLYREHSRTTRERDVFDGYEELDVEGRGESADPHGKVTGSNVQRGKRERARRRKVVDEDVKHVSLGDQKILNERSLTLVPKRNFYLVRGGEAFGPLETEEVIDTWYFPGLRDEMIAEHVDWQERDGLSRPILDPEPTPEEEPAPAPKPVARPAQAAPKAAKGPPPKPPQGRQGGGKSKRKGMK